MMSELSVDRRDYHEGFVSLGEGVCVSVCVLGGGVDEVIAVCFSPRSYSSREA